MWFSLDLGGICLSCTWYNAFRQLAFTSSHIHILYTVDGNVKLRGISEHVGVAAAFGLVVYLFRISDETPLSLTFFFLLNHSKQMWRYYLDEATAVSFHILSSLLFTSPTIHSIAYSLRYCQNDAKWQHCLSN